LRSFIVLLVVAHHAFLAYHPYAPAPSANFSSQPLLWTAFPVVDSRRWAGIDLFLGFNDIFFMALMFFLSGLFVWPSLERKGASKFLSDRFLRLGLPFTVAVAVLAPLAYYPAYLVTGNDPSPLAFLKQWRALGSWPSGPAWFIWVLLAFDSLAAVIYRIAPGFGNALGRSCASGDRRPATIFLGLVIGSAAAYLTMAFVFDPMRWIGAGPFFFQVSRILHYAIYFFAGIGVGACGLERGLLAREGRLGRRWPIWILASVIFFVLAIGAFIALVAAMAKGGIPTGLQLFVNLTFVLSCAASGFAFLSLFMRFAQVRVRLFDRLSDNSYGIYLFHYVFVTWLQFGLLGLALSGAVKGLLVFLGALALSWATTAGIRRVQVIARLI
jgi:hypothetical protein